MFHISITFPFVCFLSFLELLSPFLFGQFSVDLQLSQSLILPQLCKSFNTFKHMRSSFSFIFLKKALPKLSDILQSGQAAFSNPAVLMPSWNHPSPLPWEIFGLAFGLELKSSSFLIYSLSFVEHLRNSAWKTHYLGELSYLGKKCH